MDANKFNGATEAELKQSLQDLCDYFSQKSGREKITLIYDLHKLKAKQFLQSKNDGLVLGLSFIDSIYLMPNEELTSYKSYLEMFDTIIHESFHQFQYYFLNLPKCFADDVMWERILKYNYFYLSQGSKESDNFALQNNIKLNNAQYLLYRFSSFEVDAYRATDFLLNKICKALKKTGADVLGLKKYINFERGKFLKEAKMLKTNLKDNAFEKIDDYFKFLALKNIKETEELKISNAKLEKMCEEGEYLYSITNNNEIAQISQKFINNAQKNFKFFLPHLYSTSSKGYDLNNDV